MGFLDNLFGNDKKLYEKVIDRDGYNYETRLETVRKIKDQKLLIDIANNGKLEHGIIEVAESKIVNKRLLNKFKDFDEKNAYNVVTDSWYDYDFRLLYLELMEDEKLLADIALNPNIESEFARIAKSKVKDKSLLDKPPVNNQKTENTETTCRYYKDGVCVAGGMEYSCSANPKSFESCHVWKLHAKGDISAIY
ncbi:MAG: hypothetical protein IJL02_04765 [Methanobrevibacter sp.]|uniref:hypothetical protein n=1 Tax=Methanobrevibacter sp. TaxID=66852 RepID=UPI0025D67C41|nr:hypothetical protein [Methanobrevibacter sp.]MBQ6099157.1 hypothetical protein [Methanobrevibacter sp.]